MRYETKRTWAEIDLDVIARNWHALSNSLPQGCICLGVVKADSYGHGAVPVARVLEREGCGYLAVATIDEAAELRENGITLPILILGPTPVCYAPELARLGATQAVGSAEMARGLSAALTDGTLKIHIKLDTGMGRTGFDACDMRRLDAAAEIMTLPHLDAEGVFTHFAVSDVPGDGFTALQHSRFTDAVSRLEKARGSRFRLVHCANSAAVINYPAFAHDMVRPGLALYGMYPAAEHGGIELHPAMTLKTRVAAITHHSAGDTVSYGRTFTAAGDMRVAVLPIGYADGLHRAASGKLEFSVRGRRVRQIGRICMDMCMADVTDVPECDVGDEVIIFGGDVPVEELAEAAGTINYEVTCALSRRVPRLYVQAKGAAF